MQVKQDLSESIGNTPLIRLKAPSEATGCEILGKAEFMNPGQSVKDRAALYIIRDAVRSGALRPGGKIVISGTTSGPKLDDAELTRIFFLQLSVVGSTMGTRDELASLVTMLDATGARPLIDRTIPMTDARDGFEAMAGGDVFGKIVFTR